MHWKYITLCFSVANNISLTPLSDADRFHTKRKASGRYFEQLATRVVSKLPELPYIVAAGAGR